MSTTMVVEAWKPVERGTLRGFVRVRLASGIVFNDVSVNVTENGSAWASPPARQLVDRNGVVMKDAAGKVRWQPIIEFASRKVRDAWTRQVIEALREKHPEALPVGDAP